jgi:hypothetical protein
MKAAGASRGLRVVLLPHERQFVFQARDFILSLLQQLTQFRRLGLGQPILQSFWSLTILRRLWERSTNRNLCRRSKHAAVGLVSFRVAKRGISCQNCFPRLLDGKRHARDSDLLISVLTDIGGDVAAEIHGDK